MARIALDAMGGDYAPRATIAGALLALLEIEAPHTIQLVGNEPVIREELAALTAGEYASARDHVGRIDVVHADDVIEMSDKPATAVRAKPKSSMVVGQRLQTAGKSDAFVSAGNTGAQMAASALILKLHSGLTRPAIATVLPTAGGPILLIDAGANVDCSAHELVQFARLGAVYAEDLMGCTNPVVGLLSIGEEAEKGNAVVKEANQLLRGAGLNFQGNIEGRDLPRGASDRGAFDVVVCDGFVGNVLLKFYEALAPTLIERLAAHAGLDGEHLLRAFRDLDYTEYGGAPLLGVRGVSIISHGKSSPRAIKNALRFALRTTESRMSEHIGRRLAAAVAEGQRA